MKKMKRIKKVTEADIGLTVEAIPTKRKLILTKDELELISSMLPQEETKRLFYSASVHPHTIREASFRKIGEPTEHLLNGFQREEYILENAHYESILDPGLEDIMKRYSLNTSKRIYSDERDTEKGFYDSDADELSNEDDY